MDCNVHTLSDIYTEIETTVNEQLTLILQLQNNPEDLLKKHNLDKLELDVCSKFGALVVQDKSEDANIETEIKSLDSLLSSFIVDTREKNWLHLNKKLQDCVLSTEEEMFRKGLQIHYKVITTPAISAFGYLNLLETLDQLSTLLHPEVVQQRTKTVLKLLLKTQSELLRNTNPSKSKNVEKVIAHFIVMLNSHTDTLKTLAQVDIKASWFQKFTYSAPNRKITFTYFKKTNLINYFLTLVIKHPNTDENLIHCIYLLNHYFNWHQAFFIFQFKTEKAFALEEFVIGLLKRINSLDDKSNSVKQPLGSLLRILFKKQPNLIINSDTCKRLFEPLLFQNKPLYVTVGTNTHVLEILNNICKIPNAFKLLLESKPIKGNSNNSSIVEKHNVVEVMTNLTIMCIRTFINDSEKQFYIDNNVFNIINCCLNLLNTHVQMLNCANFTKLIDILQDLYNIVLNYNFSTDFYKIKVATVLCILIELDYGVLKILANRVLKEVVETVLTDFRKSTWCNFVLSLAHTTEGLILIENNYHIVIKQLLLNIWTAEKEEKPYEVCSRAFLQVITILNNFHVIKALLQYENEGTICGSQEKPVTLSELIENCLDVNYLGTTDVVLGLQSVQILTTNLDVLLYLEHNYKLQENLIELQDRSNSKYCENSPNAMVIDECSLLRHYLLLSLKYIGSINTGINERLLNNSKILTAPHQSIFIPRTSNALQKFLHSYKNSVHDHNWVSQAKKSFRISCNSKYKASIVLDLIEQVLKSLSTKSTWPSLDIVLYGLFPEDYYGITTVVHFSLGLLHVTCSLVGKPLDLSSNIQSFGYPL